MTRKLETLFDLPTDTYEPNLSDPLPPSRQELADIDAAIDKIDAALPGVRGLDSSDTEMDEIADLAKKSFEDLSDLAMNVDSRYAGELFSVASTMLGHAITAKTAKMNKKLKVIQLQLQKAKLDQEKAKTANYDSTDSVETAQGQVLTRNDLLDRLLAARDQKNES